MAILYFTPSTKIDAAKCDECYLDFSYSYNAEFGCFGFEEDKEMIDNLEIILTKINEENDINGYFEIEE